MPNTQFIVKVQVPMDTNMEPLALVYNKDRSLEWMLPIEDDLRKAMDGGYKQYWFAHLEDKVIILDRVAPWQDW